MMFSRWMFETCPENVPMANGNYDKEMLVICRFQQEYDYWNRVDVYRGFLETQKLVQDIEVARIIGVPCAVARPCPYTDAEMERRYCDLHYRIQGTGAVCVKKEDEQQDPSTAPSGGPTFTRTSKRHPDPWSRRVKFEMDNDTEQRALQKEDDDLKRIDKYNQEAYERLRKWATTEGSDDKKKKAQEATSFWSQSKQPEQTQVEEEMDD